VFGVSGKDIFSFMCCTFSINCEKGADLGSNRTKGVDFGSNYNPDQINLSLLVRMPRVCKVFNSCI
jgi:hypothetical protein